MNFSPRNFVFPSENKSHLAGKQTPAKRNTKLTAKAKARKRHTKNRLDVAKKSKGMQTKATSLHLQSLIHYSKCNSWQKCQMSVLCLTCPTTHNRPCGAPKYRWVPVNPPDNSKSYRNWTPISAMLICPLNSNIS